MLEHSSRRHISTFAAWAFSFGTAVGWGAFVMPGTAFLPMAGPLGTVVGVIVGAAVMAVIAWNYHYINHCRAKFARGRAALWLSLQHCRLRCVSWRHPFLCCSHCDRFCRLLPPSPCRQSGGGARRCVCNGNHGLLCGGCMASRRRAEDFGSCVFA